MPSFDTYLPPASEQKFQTWRGGLSQNLRGTTDYDLRGAWLSNAQAAANGHLPDTWKKPNHITFSTGSQYSGKNGIAPGGDWAQGSDGKWAFWASPQNMATHDVQSLVDYFHQAEPASTLILPIHYALGGAQ